MDFYSPNLGEIVSMKNFCKDTILYFINRGLAIFFFTMPHLSAKNAIIKKGNRYYIT